MVLLSSSALAQYSPGNCIKFIWDDPPDFAQDSILRIALVDTCADVPDTIWVNGTPTTRNWVFQKADDDTCMEITTVRGGFHWNMVIKTNPVDTIFWPPGDTVIVNRADTSFVRVDDPDTIKWKNKCAGGGSGCTPLIIAGEYMRDLCDTITIAGIGDINVEWNTGPGDSILIRVDTIKVPIQMYLNFYHGTTQTDSNSWFCTSYYTNLSAQMYPVANQFRIIGVSYTTQVVSSATTVGGEYRWLKSGIVTTTAGFGGKSIGVRWIKKSGSNDEFSFYTANIEGGANPATSSRTHIMTMSIDDATHLPISANYNTQITIWLTKIK